WQPFNQVPAIENDGFALYESRAICRYLSEKTESPLTPRNPKERAKMEQWLSIEASNFTPHAMKFIFHHIFKQPQEEAALEAARTSLEHCLEIVSNTLSKQPYFASEQFTLANIAFMPYVEYLQATPVAETLAKYPALIAWWKRVSERPSWKVATGK